MNWYLKVLNQYADFSGRARRQEYWMFVLLNMLIMLGFGAVLGLLSYALDAPFVMLLIYLYVFAVFVPSLAVGVRRLHDTGKSGWWYLLAFIPFASLVLLVFFCMDSDPGENEWGPNPKGEGNNRAIDKIGTE